MPEPPSPIVDNPNEPTTDNIETPKGIGALLSKFKWK